MPHLELRDVWDQASAAGVVPSLVPFVDGRSLLDLLREVELPSAQRDGQPDLAGSYAGLADPRTRWPGRHYLGEPSLTWFDDGDTVLLGCTCGEWGCWPFTVVVAAGPEVVTWGGYRHGHRAWDYTALPDLVFDRQQYEDAVRATAHRRST